MSFKFNFGSTGEEEKPEDKNERNLGGNNARLRPYIRHHPKPQHFINIHTNSLKACTVKIGQLELQYLDPNCVAPNLEDTEIYNFLDKSDLEEGQYEGGLKVWECTYDLLNYLENNQIILRDKRVLDFGCGAGLLGLYAALRDSGRCSSADSDRDGDCNTGCDCDDINDCNHGGKRGCSGRASEVYFQDYNSEVIEKFTIPTAWMNFAKLNGITSTFIDSEDLKVPSSSEGNTICEELNRDTINCKINSNLNTRLSVFSSKFKFVSGDWDAFSMELGTSEKYDVILSSETIYNEKHYKKITNFLLNHLSESGVALFGAKTHYFGVGGNTRIFMQHISRQNLNVEVVFKLETGVTREILKITKSKTRRF